MATPRHSRTAAARTLGVMRIQLGMPCRCWLAALPRSPTLPGSSPLDMRTVKPYDVRMNIRSIRHRGLRRLIEHNDGRGIRPDQVERIRNVLAALIIAPDMNGVIGPPGWRIHQLSGDRRGTWSISVTGNWRLTFRLEDGDILNLDLEDYH